MIERVFKSNGIELEVEQAKNLQTYHGLLLKWQKAINLVSNATLDEAVERHFLDSAQLIKHIPNKEIVLVDMGSGAGFPGLVLAMLGVKEVHLIESDVRKSTFLRTVSRETNISVTVHDERIEDVSVPNIDLITSRALAAMPDLLTMAKGLETESHPLQCLFLKGEKAQRELERAAKRWVFESSLHSSVTDKTGYIVEISNIQKKP